MGGNVRSIVSKRVSLHRKLKLEGQRDPASDRFMEIRPRDLPLVHLFQRDQKLAAQSDFVALRLETLQHEPGRMCNDEVFPKLFGLNDARALGAVEAVAFASSVELLDHLGDQDRHIRGGVPTPLRSVGCNPRARQNGVRLLPAPGDKATNTLLGIGV